MAGDLSHDGIKAWALQLIARGASTGDLELDVAGYYAPLSSDECAAIADAAIRGDEATVTAKAPAGLTRENTESICRGV